MRKLRNYFVMLTVAILALFSSSCSSSDDEEDLEVFIKYAEAENFYNTYKAHGGPKALIDFRSAEKFAQGSLPEAKNFPATTFNTQDNNSQWCKDILAEYPTNTCLFLFGDANFQMQTVVGGRASKIGYGKQNTRVSNSSYEKLKAIWK